MSPMRENLKSYQTLIIFKKDSVNLFKFIVFGILSIITSSLYAEYLNFNLEKGYFKHSTLSPDKRFLLVPGYSPSIPKLYNLETGQLHGELEWCERPFFSQDSTAIFAAVGQEVDRYEILGDEVIKVDSMTLKNRDFSPLFETSYIQTNDIITRLGTKKDHRDGIFISTLSEKKKIGIKELSAKKIQFIIHLTKACTLSHDALHAAIVCDKTTTGHFYVHVIDTKKRTTTHTYQLNRQSPWHSVNSINFSPDKNKLILTAQYPDYSSKPEVYAYWVIILDLQTDESSWFKQEHQVEFADFINNSIILMIFNDGSVRYQELTPENLDANRISDENRFNVIDDPARFP